MKIIAFDESGNTGGDLLHKDQPVFVLASIKISTNEAKELIGLFEVQKNTTELKFSKLRKSEKHQDSLKALLAHPYISSENVRISVFHKDYCIWVHTVDRLIEPLAYDIDIDLYKNGLNISLTNTLYYLTEKFCDKLIVDDYKKSFSKLFRYRNSESILEFYAVLNALILTCKDEQLKNLLITVAQSEKQIDDILDGFKSSNFDSYLTAFIYQIEFWTQSSDVYFDVYIDPYKSLKDFEHYIETIRAINLNVEVGTDRRTLKLPLKLKNVIQESSEKNPAIQIADLIAGLASHYYKGLIDVNCRDYMFNKIDTNKINSFLQNIVWPHPAFTPEDTDTVYTGGRNV